MAIFLDEMANSFCDNGLAWRDSCFHLGIEQFEGSSHIGGHS